MVRSSRALLLPLATILAACSGAAPPLGDSVVNGVRIGERIEVPREAEAVTSKLVQEWVNASFPGVTVETVEWHREGVDGNGVQPIRGGSFAGVAVVILADGAKSAVTIACGLGYRDCRTVRPVQEVFDDLESASPRELAPTPSAVESAEASS